MAPRLVLLLLLASCGRTGLVLDGVDAGLDAGVRPTVQREPPFFVAVEDGACAKAGLESDLKLREQGERLVLIKTKAVSECSGAGGEYLVGTEVSGARDAFLGAHACYFFSPALLQREGDELWGLARLSQTAALFRTPEGWCVTSLAGREPVLSDSKPKAWAVYATEASARAALQALSQP